jgi:hypothetical protein
MISVKVGHHTISVENGDSDLDAGQSVYLNGRYLGSVEDVMGIPGELDEAHLKRWALEFTPEYFDELNECVGWVSPASERGA